jgi:hypothetical protein
VQLSEQEDLLVRHVAPIEMHAGNFGKRQEQSKVRRGRAAELAEFASTAASDLARSRDCTYYPPRMPTPILRQVRRATTAAVGRVAQTPAEGQYP